MKVEHIGDAALYVGDVRETLKGLSDESVQCVVTSPPYWGLRDYGNPGQLGLEPTPEEYTQNMVEVFREVRRVLRDDGTAWLNLGDSYNGVGRGEKANGLQVAARATTQRTVHGLKPKDLVGIPWRVAFALQADGWYLRQEIIWAKPNPMPESVTDRCTKAHEYVFLLAKGQWKSRVVGLSDLHSNSVHLGQDLWLSSPDSGAITISIGIASAILNCTEFQEKFGLASFDPQVWKQRLSGGTCGSIGCLPIEHTTALLATRLLLSDCSAKEFLSKIYSMGITLADSDNFLVGGVDAKFPLSPSIDAYGKTSIAVHDSGKICQFNFVHGTIIYQTPNGCNYYYDAEAVKEAAVIGETGEQSQSVGPKHMQGVRFSAANGHNLGECTGKRNRRSVWTVATQPYSGAHFATFPPKLIEPMILAGTSAKGQCPHCGAPWVRVVEKSNTNNKQNEVVPDYDVPGLSKGTSHDRVRRLSGSTYQHVRKYTNDWQPSCTCPEHDPVPQTVLDPFGGSGTTAGVALEHGRKAILCELSPEYAALIPERIRSITDATDQPGLFSAPKPTPIQLDAFETVQE